MAFGAFSTKKRMRRPYFPEYRERSNVVKQLLYYTDSQLVTCEGEIFAQDCKSALEYAMKNPCVIFVDSLKTQKMLQLVSLSVQSPCCSVSCDYLGRPMFIRIQRWNIHSWIIPWTSWDMAPGIDSLSTLVLFFEYMGVGSAPTPSSLGRKTMRIIYESEQLYHHYSPSMNCEKYLNTHGFGGITITNFVGDEFSVVSEIDCASKYLEENIEDEYPDKTPSWFIEGDEISDFHTYFASCEVTITRELPLGIFPVRTADRRVEYPVKPGTYSTHLWKEQVTLCEENDVHVKVLSGWGWGSSTLDNSPWAKWIYQKKIDAPSKELERLVKKCAVSAIGSMGRDRTVYSLTTQELKGQESVPLIIGREPLNLWIVEGSDTHSGLMPHWQKYTVQMANNRVRNFALPYAEQGNLILIDTDAVFVKGEEAGRNYVEKHSIESVGIPAGSWLSKIHHGFKVLRNRMWLSDEEPGRYGKLLERIVK